VFADARAHPRRSAALMKHPDWHLTAAGRDIALGCSAKPP